MGKIFSAFLLSLALTGCAGFGAAKSPDATAAQRQFNFNRATAAITAGQAAIKKGDLGRAITSLQTGLDLWPAEQPGWAALARAYTARGDTVDANYADFFAERIEWANSLHGMTAALAFDNIALIDKTKPFADRRIPRAAALLSAFYRQGEANIRSVQAAKTRAQQTFGQRYLVYPVAVLTGGVVTYQLLRANGIN